LLKLLQGAPQELALDAQMIGLGVSADDFEELVWRGARLLRQADCVSNGFSAVLQQVEALPLGDGLWWLHSEQTVKRPGLAFVTPDKPMRYLGQPLSGLFCLASLGEAHQALLERLCALLIEGRGHELGRATSSRKVLEVLGGELPADWPSARIAWPTPMVCMRARRRSSRNWRKVLKARFACASSMVKTARCR
jgi:mannitol/fructose-specific phosphotransferase system IIA component (Ntr-type)